MIFLLRIIMMIMIYDKDIDDYERTCLGHFAQG